MPKGRATGGGVGTESSTDDDFSEGEGVKKRRVSGKHWGVKGGVLLGSADIGLTAKVRGLGLERGKREVEGLVGLNQV